MTWFFWAFAPLIAFAAEINQGVGLQSVFTFMVGFNPLLIFLASFTNKKSVWKGGMFDAICGVLAVIGLVLWFITRVGNIAIIFSILVDSFAAFPTIVKSYHHPETENYRIYLFGAIAALVTLASLTTWSFAHFAFPVYIITVNSILILLIKFNSPITPQECSSLI